MIFNYEINVRKQLNNNNLMIPKNEIYICATSNDTVFINIYNNKSLYTKTLNLCRVNYEKKINYKQYFMSNKLEDQKFSIILLSDDCICLYDRVCTHNNTNNYVKYIYDLSNFGIIINEIYKIWILTVNDSKHKKYIHFIQLNNGIIYVCNLHLENIILDIINGFTVDMNIEIVCEGFNELVDNNYLIISRMFIYRYKFNEKQLNVLNDNITIEIFNNLKLDKIKFGKQIAKYCGLVKKNLIFNILLCNKYISYKKSLVQSPLHLPIYLIFMVIKYIYDDTFY